MITFIMHIRKRADISDEEFATYYETRHLPLIGRLIGSRPVRYRRFYAARDSGLLTRLASGRGDTALADVSVITELSFADKEQAQGMVDQMLAKDVLGAVLEDERAFIAEGGITCFVAETKADS